MTPLTGRESSILALLAQSRGLSAADKKRILGSLNGQALRIARCIVGLTKNPSASVRRAADGFIDWANKLPPY